MRYAIGLPGPWPAGMRSFDFFRTVEMQVAMKEASVLPPASTLPCKICAGTARKQFGLPHNKKAAHTIPDEPDDCWYYECERCGFLFSPARDEDDQGAIYDETYWTKQDPDWYGRVSQTVRLVALANELLGRKLEDLEILDFGCGMGGFVHQGREHLQLQVWGTDIIKPQVGLEHYLPELGSRQFDVITCCEVVEHFPEPKDTFAFMRKHLKSPGGPCFSDGGMGPRARSRVVVSRTTQRAHQHTESRIARLSLQDHGRQDETDLQGLPRPSSMEVRVNYPPIGRYSRCGGGSKSPGWTT